MKRVTSLLSIYVILTGVYVLYGSFFGSDGYSVWHWYLFTSTSTVMPLTMFLFAVSILFEKLITGGDTDGTGFRGKAKWTEKGKNVKSN